MPKVAIFFFIILLSSTVTNSHGFISGDLTSLNKIQNPIIFDSGIVEVDSNFFTQNDVKRYLIFGNNLQNNEFLKTNSIYGIQSDNGFF